MSARFPPRFLRAFHADRAPLSDRIDPVVAAEKGVWWALGASVLTVVLLVLRGDPQQVEWLVSEEGILEQASALAWLLLAALVMLRGGFERHAVSLAAICLVFCAREYDLHKIVADTSFLKANFYRGDAIALHDKLLGGALAIAVLGVVFGGLAFNAAAFVRRRLWRQAWGRIVLLAAVLLVLTKVFDRTPAILKDEIGWPLGWTATHLVTLHEEWIECFVPLSLCVAALLRRRGAPPRS